MSGTSEVCYQFFLRTGSCKLYLISLFQISHNVSLLFFISDCIVTNNNNNSAGQERIRTLWRHYYEDVNGIIFVLDSSNRERFIEAKHALEVVLGDVRMDKLSLLILANKQDLEGAATPAEIAKEFGLSHLHSKRKYHVQCCCAITGDGLLQGLEWLSETLSSPA